MTAREVKLWKFACPALAAAAFAVDAFLFWWLQAWEYAPSDRKGAMLFNVLAAGLFLFPFGSYLLSRAIFDFKRARASLRWPTVQGRVLTRSVEERRTFTRRGNVTTYVPRLRYEYEIAGQGYQSDTIQFGLKDVGTREEAEQILGAMAPDTPVEVHYDPEYPQLAVLQSASQRSLRMIMSAALLFAIPFVVAISRGLGR